MEKCLGFSQNNADLKKIISPSFEMCPS
jgi:hypothetical protein